MIYNKSFFAYLFLFLLFKILKFEFLGLFIAFCQEWSGKLLGEVFEVVEWLLSPFLASYICLHEDGEIIIIVFHYEEILGARYWVIQAVKNAKEQLTAYVSCDEHKLVKINELLESLKDLLTK